LRSQESLQSSVISHVLSYPEATLEVKNHFNLSDNQSKTGSEDSLAFNSSKEPKKSYMQWCISEGFPNKLRNKELTGKLVQYVPDPSTNPKLWDLKLQEI
jgi:hypothetical protein